MGRPSASFVTPPEGLIGMRQQQQARPVPPAEYS